MFEARLAQAGLLKSAVQSIKGLAVVAAFYCDSKSMCLHTKHSNDNAYKAVLEMRRGHFTTYMCDFIVKFSVRMTDLSDALRTALDTDSCTIKYDCRNESRVLTLSFHDATGGNTRVARVERVGCTFPPLATTDRRPLLVLVAMPTWRFEEMLDMLIAFSDTLDVTFNERSGVTFSARDNTTGSGSAHFNNLIQGEVVVDGDQPVRAAYSMEHLQQFTKDTSPFSDRVALYFYSTHLVADFVFRDGELSFVLCPKQ